jgi:hypothetical protein
VTIPGYDKPIDFPDSMSQDQINAASKKLYEAKHPPASTDPSGRTPTGEPAPGDTRNALQRTLDNLITPDPRREEWQSPGRNMADTFARGVAENVVPLVSHPLKSVGGMLRKAGQAIADNPGNATGAASDFFIKPLVEQGVSDYQSGGLAKAVPHMAGTGAGLWATGELGGEALRKTGKVLKSASGSVGDALRKGAQTVVGGGTRNVARAVSEEADAAKTAEAGHLDKSYEAAHETQGRELSHDQAVRKAKGEADTANKLNLKEHLAKRDQTIVERKAAEEKLTADKLKQGKTGPTQAKLENAWSSLRAAVETAREKALGIGNAKYSGVNEALSHIEADPKTYSDALQSAGESLRGAKSEPTILKQMSEKWGKGEVPTYADLQGDYSRLGKEISKGSLDGDVFHAYDKLHEALGDEMQRIADSNGQGAALQESRAYWRRMKQTFGKKLPQADAATDVLRSAAPNLLEQDTLANRIRLLGSFDEGIPKTFAHIQNVQQGVDSLPKPMSERQLEQGAKAPNLPPRKPIVPSVEAKMPAEPERVEAPNRPQTTEINTRQVRDNLITQKLREWTNVSKWQLARIMSGPLGVIIGAVSGHPLFEVGAGAYTVGELSPFMIQKMLDKASFREWLTRPPTEELQTLQQIPGAERLKITDGLAKTVQAAQARGIEVDPRLYAIAGVAAPKKTPGDILRQAQ